MEWLFSLPLPLFLPANIRKERRIKKQKYATPLRIKGGWGLASAQSRGSYYSQYSETSTFGLVIHIYSGYWCTWLGRVRQGTASSITVIRQQHLARVYLWYI